MIGQLRSASGKLADADELTRESRGRYNIITPGEWFLFGSILLLGVVARIIVGTHSLGFVHPDEHQQYLEAANRIAYGYGMSFWEYERGIRHFLYPGFLASVLKCLDLIGFQHPVQQAQIIRSLMGLTVFGTSALIALQLLRSGKRYASFALLLMTAGSPYFLFMGARTLSETAVMPLMMLMWFSVDRRPVLAGAIGGLMFAVRFQTALFVAPFFFAIVFDSFRRRRGWSHQTQAMAFATGCVVTLLVGGFIDWWTWGSWFHSPIEYFRANILEDVASSFGVSPWYQYLLWAAQRTAEVSWIVFPLALIGARRHQRLAIAVLIFVISHSLIGHKESRFLWPIVPILLVLVAEGIEVCLQRFPTPRQRRICLVLVCFFALSAKFQYDGTDWHRGKTEASSLALAALGSAQ